MPFTVWALALAQALLGTGNILLVSINALIGNELAIRSDEKINIIKAWIS